MGFGELTLFVTLACRCFCLCQRSPGFISSLSVRTLPATLALTPNNRSGRAPAPRYTSPSHTPRLSPGPTAPGQHLAASIGSTDPPIARLPNWGLATRDKAEGAPPSGPQTAHGTYLHNILSLQ